MTMKCTRSPYLLDRSSVAAHRCRKGGQVNEPRTITTGLSLSIPDRLILMPLVSKRAKSTATAPSARPTLVKLAEVGGLQPRLRAWDNDGPPNSGVLVDIGVGDVSAAGSVVRGSVAAGLQLASRSITKLRVAKNRDFVVNVFST
jgi:hypothetical protein